MSSDILSAAVNWPAFALTTGIIILRTYLPCIYLWIVERFHSASLNICRLVDEIKSLTNELESISPQHEFSAYTKKKRQKDALLEKLKEEKSRVESNQKKSLLIIRVISNILAFVSVIYLSRNNGSYRMIPVFQFDFSHFPLIIWIFALNTFLSTLTNIFKRHQMFKQNKRSVN